MQKPTQTVGGVSAVKSLLHLTCRLLAFASPSLLGINRIYCYLYVVPTDIFSFSVCSLHNASFLLCGRYVNTFYKLGFAERSASVSIEFIKLYNDYSLITFLFEG